MRGWLPSAAQTIASSTALQRPACECLGDPTGFRSSSGSSSSGGKAAAAGEQWRRRHQGQEQRQQHQQHQRQ